MSAQHTPGPWSYSRWDQFGDTRFYVAQAEGAPYTPNYSDVATLVAETVSSEYVRIQEANARLIAAAPELLAFAQSLIDDYRSDDGMASAKHIVKLAQEVVAKATDVQAPGAAPE